MNFTKLTDNLLKAMDRYVYRPMGRSAIRVADVLFSDKAVKLVYAPAFFVGIVLIVAGLASVAKYEKENPCLEWVETGEQVCSTHCVNTGQKYAPPICSTSCRPEEKCVVRQMADGSIQRG
jgi:hypothetical protein